MTFTLFFSNHQGEREASPKRIKAVAATLGTLSAASPAPGSETSLQLWKWVLVAVGSSIS